MFTKPFRIYQGNLLNAVICFGLFPKEAKSRYFVVSTEIASRPTWIRDIVMQTGAIVTLFK